MVLEGSSDPPDSSSSFPPAEETPPLSDFDPYGDNDSNPPYSEGRYSSYVNVSPAGASPVYVNLESIPQPIFLPSSGTVKAAWFRACEQGLIRQSRRMEDILHRPATEEEANAVAFHFGKSMRYTSFGPSIGMAVATAMFLRGRRTYRFPFWSPMKDGGRLSPDRFLFLRGSMARAMWQVTRFNAYFLLCEFGAIYFFMFYGATVGAVGQRSDPRLKDYNTAVVERFKQGLVERQNRRETDRAAENRIEGARSGETFEMARQRKSVQQQQDRRRSKEKENSKSPQDDMSPTSGAFEDDFMESRSDSGLMSDSEQRRYQTQYQTSSSEQAASSSFDTMYQNNPQSRSRDLAAQPSSSSSPSRSTAQKQQSGSAWDRLRQGAMNSGGDQPSNAGSSASTSPRRSGDTGSIPNANDSFSFSQSDEDRQLAKSEAQKQFDARIEQERQGKDFDDRSSSGSSSGRW